MIISDYAAYQAIQGNRTLGFNESVPTEKSLETLICVFYRTIREWILGRPYYVPLKINFAFIKMGLVEYSLVILLQWAKRMI